MDHYLRLASYAQHPVYNSEAYPIPPVHSYQSIQRAKSSNALHQISQKCSQSETTENSMQQTYFRLFAARNKSRHVGNFSAKKQCHQAYSNYSNSLYSKDQFHRLKACLSHCEIENSKLKTEVEALTDQNNRLKQEIEKRQINNLSSIKLTRLQTFHEPMRIEDNRGSWSNGESKLFSDASFDQLYGIAPSNQENDEICELLKQAEMEIRERDEMIAKLNEKIATQSSAFSHQLINKLKESQSELGLLRTKISYLQHELKQYVGKVEGLLQTQEQQKQRLTQKQREIDLHIQQAQKSFSKCHIQLEETKSGPFWNPKSL